MQYKIQRKLIICPNDETLILQWKRINYFLCQNYKLELGMESIFQLSGQLILYLNSISKTKTNEGLDEVFRIEDNFLLEVLFLGSLICSLLSSVLSHVQGLSAKRVHFPIISVSMVIIYGLLACVMRVLSFTMYFTPGFGLFNVLSHLKEEQTPWHPDLKRQFVKNDFIQFGDSPQINWNEIDRWKIDETGELSPPQLTLYTYFTLKQYFLMFWIILTTQTFVVYLIKSKLSNNFYNFNFIEKCIHAFENCSIPYNAFEWEDGGGDSNAHRKRMKNNFKEIMLLISLNLVFNCILLFPLCILGKIRNIFYVVTLLSIIS